MGNRLIQTGNTHIQTHRHNTPPPPPQPPTPFPKYIPSCAFPPPTHPPTPTHTCACMCTHIFAYTYHICCLSLLIVWWLQTVYTRWLHGLPNTTASFLIVLMGTASVLLFSVLNTGCCIVCAWACSHLMCFVLRLQCKWDCNRDHWLLRLCFLFGTVEPLC